MKRKIKLTMLTFFGLCHFACVPIIRWTPVCNGIEYEGDSIVKIDDVEILVQDFESWGGSLNPEFTLWIKNRGDSQIVFDAAACYINIDGIIVTPDKSTQIGIHYVEAYDYLEIKFKFLENIQLALKDSSKTIEGCMERDTITLQIAPIEIGGQQHSIPKMTYKYTRF